MNDRPIGCLKFTSLDWLKLLGIMLAHACVVFGALLHWANRVVAVEVKIDRIDQTIREDVAEIRADVKQLLQRLHAP